MQLTASDLGIIMAALVNHPLPYKDTAPLIKKIADELKKLDTPPVVTPIETAKDG